MLAWMGGKQRLVQLAKHQAAHRGGGGSSTSAGAGQGALGDQQPAGRGRKRSRSEEAEQHGWGRAPAATVPPAAVLASGAAQLSPGGRRATQLKRVAAVPRSLDLLALQMPQDWQPTPPAAAAAAAEREGGTELPPGEFTPRLLSPRLSRPAASAGSQRQ